MTERLNETFHNTEDNWQSASLQQEDSACLHLFDLSPIDDDDPLDNFLMLLWIQQHAPETPA
uniref:Uncharacterized protein n=1 Tax=Meloidogyne enterolobii TaxID=390850 RepID=A0A6V7UJE7_MELEN|nr:unnamed protein product [Meloidogyne enterolobii]